MTIVRFIFLFFTIPVRILPRILTLPVNGHFLSIYDPSVAYKLITDISQILIKAHCALMYQTLLQNILKVTKVNSTTLIPL